MRKLRKGASRLFPGPKRVLWAGGLLIAVLLLLLRPIRADDPLTSTVGMPARISQVLPGSELEVRPLENPRSPIVLRIVEAAPFGNGYRYDFVYYGLDPGEFDLKSYLRRKDGSTTDDLPAMRVTVRPVLPPGQIQPNKLESGVLPFLGGYRLALTLGGVIWLLVLLTIIFGRRRKKRQDSSESNKPLTVAERLRPLVENAIAGRLPPDELAHLERTLLAYWRRRLHLQEKKPAEAMAYLRGHQEAGPLLNRLEVWLHSPGTAEFVDVAVLLRPYGELPAEELE